MLWWINCVLSSVLYHTVTVSTVSANITHQTIPLPFSHQKFPIREKEDIGRQRGIHTPWLTIDHALYDIWYKRWQMTKDIIYDIIKRIIHRRCTCLRPNPLSPPSHQSSPSPILFFPFSRCMESKWCTTATSIDHPRAERSYTGKKVQKRFRSPNSESRPSICVACLLSLIVYPTAGFKSFIINLIVNLYNIYL